MNMTLKEKTFSDVAQLLRRNNINVEKIDQDRPWGGFFVLAEKDASKFISFFFPELPESSLNGGKLSPKILLVEPGRKLSWQYHHRRAEIWRLIDGAAAVIRSDDDFEKELYKLSPGETIELRMGERHRLVGLNEWGIVAEIWMHTDPENPSDENDIVRLQDDFGRRTPLS
jgi:mannose-6-phosphate isomerase-like protein (cupin superfamily)